MSRTTGTELDPLVDSFQHLSSMPRANEALHALKKIASMVKPIMRRRNWRVGTLAEFYPAESNLLGMNHNGGQMIQLRLRYPGDKTQFVPFEQVVDTMLHELSHIVVGPHNQEFHALWDKLRDEHESLLRKGYTGEGFLGHGNRLGGRHIPRSEIQRQARAAAEARQKNAELARGTGRKLGGTGILRGQNARDVIAAAVEKRNRINSGCGNAHPQSVIGLTEEQQGPVVTTQAERADEDEDALMQAYIDMIQEEEDNVMGSNYVKPSQDNPTGGWRTENGSVKPPADVRKLREEQLQIEQQLNGQTEYEPESKPKYSLSGSSRATLSSDPSAYDPEMTQIAPATRPPTLPQQEDFWTCEICTLINPITYLMCGACETERPERFNQPTKPSLSMSSKTKPAADSRLSPQAAKNRHPKLLASSKASENIAKFSEAERLKAQSTPVGWTCGRCGNWMEMQWWTCSVCGNMKTSS
jgi:DNA-dependent metalloprotease WSS1